MQAAPASVKAVLGYLRSIGGELHSQSGTGLGLKIADAVGMNVRTVNWALRRLEASGRIERTIRGRRTYAIRALEVSDETASEALGANDSRDGRTRQLLLQAAMELFQSKGYHGASMRSIGEKAGFTGPALYHHFADKQELLAAAFFYLGDIMFSQVDEAFSDELSPHEALSQLVRDYIDVVSEYRSLFPLVFSEFRNLKPSDQEISRRRREQLRERWGQAISKVRPDLDTVEAQTLALGAAWIIHSISFVDLPADDDNAKKQMLFDMAMSCIVATSFDNPGPPPHAPAS